MDNNSVSNSDTAVYHKIIARLRDTFHRRVVFNQSVMNVDGTFQSPVPEDITASSFRMTVIRRGDPRKTPVISFVENDFIRSDPGVIEFGKTAAEMIMLPGNYWYDIQQTYSDGTVRTRMQGDFIITNDVTT